MKESKLKKGQPITFRIPSTIAPHTLQKLQKLKTEEKRNFSSRIAQFVMDGIDHSLVDREEVITLPLPQELNETQRDWLKHEQSVALLGSVIYELTSNPVRAAQLFAVLNHEEGVANAFVSEEKVNSVGESEQVASLQPTEEALEQFEWTSAKDFVSESESKSEDADPDPLHEFLSQMNK